MKIKYIKADDWGYRPTPKNTIVNGQYQPVCYIEEKKDHCVIRFYDTRNMLVDDCFKYPENQEPNTEIVVYPSGIQQIEYIF